MGVRRPAHSKALQPKKTEIIWQKIKNMPNIHIITLGKLKEKFWREAESEYLKRLSPYYQINIHEIREESFDKKVTKNKSN